MFVAVCRVSCAVSVCVAHNYNANLAWNKREKLVCFSLSVPISCRLQVKIKLDSRLLLCCVSVLCVCVCVCVHGDRVSVCGVACGVWWCVSVFSRKEPKSCLDQKR